MAWVEESVTICTDILTILGDTFDWNAPATVPVAPGDWESTNHTRSRGYAAEYSLADLDGLRRCTIIPASYDAEWISRNKRQEMYGIDVILLYKTNERDKRDRAMLDVETLCRVLEQTALATSTARWVGLDRPTLFDADRMDEENVLAVSSRHNYMLVRDKGLRAL